MTAPQVATLWRTADGEPVLVQFIEADGHVFARDGAGPCDYTADGWAAFVAEVGAVLDERGNDDDDGTN